MLERLSHERVAFAERSSELFGCHRKHVDRAGKRRQRREYVWSPLRRGARIGLSLSTIHVCRAVTTHSTLTL